MPLRPSCVRAYSAMALGAGLLAMLAAGCFSSVPGPPPFPRPSTAHTLTPSADTYIASDFPNTNFGTLDSMNSRRESWDTLRAALIAFDHTAIIRETTAGRLDSAFLELRIQHVTRGPSGGHALLLNRVLVPWTERAATFRCGIDRDLTNPAPDCSGNEWPGPAEAIYSVATDSVLADTARRWIRLRVTADV